MDTVTMCLEVLVALPAFAWGIVLETEAKQESGMDIVVFKKAELEACI
jgi:hypothetical protein